MEISDLIGPSTLTGVDVFHEHRKTYEWADDTENVEVVRVGLGSRVIEFWEDPEDVYRSCHNGPEEVNVTLSNRFQPINVMCERLEEGRHQGEYCDVLRITNAATGAVILEIGTDNIADYYPSWVCNFSAEAIGEIA